VGPLGEPVAVAPPVGPHAPGAFAGIGPEVPFSGPNSVLPGPMAPANHLTGGPGMSGSGGIVLTSGPMSGPGGVVPAAGPMGPPIPPGVFAPQGVVNAAGAMPNQVPNAFPVQRSQIKFVGPAGAKISWYVASGETGGDGRPVRLQHALPVPGRYNFLQASIYRIKLSDIPGRPGVELYPTIEVVPANPKTDAFLAHNYIPVDFTEEDFDQISAGNYITKVIYLPDVTTQSQAATGIEELVSTRLEPGVDPIAEAHRRGHILCVVRVGGIMLETANSPAMDAPGPFAPPPRQQGAMPMMNPGMAMQGGGMMPGLPGVASPMPPGLPGRPPMYAPPPPNLNAPKQAPNGPMVPAAPGAAPGVQQMGYVVGSDGNLKPVALPTTQSAMFPQTTIPPAAKPSGNLQLDNDDNDQPKPPSPRRKGLLDSWFSK
jgi:hypothetical protein